jgi:hypothetical protein
VPRNFCGLVRPSSRRVGPEPPFNLHQRPLYLTQTPGRLVRISHRKYPDSVHWSRQGRYRRQPVHVDRLRADAPMGAGLHAPPPSTPGAGLPFAPQSRQGQLRPLWGSQRGTAVEGGKKKNRCRTTPTFTGSWTATMWPGCDEPFKITPVYDLVEPVFAPEGQLITARHCNVWAVRRSPANRRSAQLDGLENRYKLNGPSGAKTGSTLLRTGVRRVFCIPQQWPLSPRRASSKTGLGG